MGRRILAIDTATAACSAALFEDGAILASDYQEIGRGHAEKLIPIIASLPDKGKADQILVNGGPGSFTGVRIGLSVGKALGLAWQVPVFSYQCLHLVAVQALAVNTPGGPFHVAMVGGHGEYFIQNFDANGGAVDNLRSLPPAEALAYGKGDLVAGSAAESLAELAANRTAIPMFPDAANTLHLPESERMLSATPVYGRPPDARIMPQGA